MNTTDVQVVELLIAINSETFVPLYITVCVTMSNSPSRVLIILMKGGFPLGKIFRANQISFVQIQKNFG